MRLDDWFARTRFDERYLDAELVLDAQVANPERHDLTGWALLAQVIAADGSLAAEGQAELMAVDETGLTSLTLPVSRPKQWSAETPNLYDVVLTLIDAAGRPQARAPSATAFGRCSSEGESCWSMGAPSSCWASTGTSGIQRVATRCPGSAWCKMCAY